MCTDPDGAPCFPLHGLAPHTHKPDSIEFHTAPVQGFTPDPGDPTHGVHWCPHCGDGKPAEPTAPKFSPYGGFSEGDHVTRDGTDVHLVKDMTADGFAATFVCVVAPATRWTAVGEEEFNVCRRYARLKRDEATQEWKQDPDAKPNIQPLRGPAEVLGPVFKRIREVVTYDLAEFLSKWKPPIAGGPVTMQELLPYQTDWLYSLYVDPRKSQRSAFHKAKLKRHPKRRALRK